MPVMDFPSAPVNGQQTADGRYYFDSSVGSTGAWRSTPLPVGGLPAGSIMAWGTNTPPANWLIADGSAVSRSLYSSLFAVIGTQYGAGDGTTTFNLPDLRGRVPVGRNGGTFGTLGATGGAETHTLTEAQIPPHTHSWSSQSTNDVNDFLGGSSASYGISASYNSSTNYGSFLSNTGGGQAHNNLQPYQVVNYIIKASAGWTAGDSELATRLGVVETRTTSLLTAAPVAVASASARDALYPTPAQGQSVFRSDTGWVETYYGLYNASTNPGGATPAGWYPTSGNMPQAKLVRNTATASFGANAWTSVTNLTFWQTEIAGSGGVTIESNGTLKTTLPGLYEAEAGIMSNGIPFTILCLKKNATSADGTGQIAGQTGYGLSGWNVTNAKTTVKMLANDYIHWSYYATTGGSSNAWSSGTEKNASFISLRYIGPPLGA